MRTWLPLTAVLLATVLPGPAAAEAPGLELALPLASEFLYPDQTETISGQLTFRFPGDASCPGGLPYGFAVANTTAGLTLTLRTPNGTLPASEVRPGQTATIAVRVDLDLAPDVVAFTDLEARVRVTTGPCGSLQAGQATGQTGARAGFLPRVNLTLVSENSRSWQVRAENRGNADVRMDWSLRQPSLGRLLSGGSLYVPGPESGAGRSANLSVPKQGTNESALVLLSGVIYYDGDYPARPEERPSTGNTSLVLYDPPDAGGSRVLQFVLLGGALALIAVGVVGGWWLRRRRP